jgi:hypothetical protein
MNCHLTRSRFFYTMGQRRRIGNRAKRTVTVIPVTVIGTALTLFSDLSFDSFDTKTAFLAILMLLFWRDYSLILAAYI